MRAWQRRAGDLGCDAGRPFGHRPDRWPAAHELTGRIGAEIKTLPDIGLERRRLITMDRFSLLAVIAAAEAARQAELPDGPSDRLRIGAVVGTGIYGAETLEENYRTLLVEHKPRAGVFTVPRVMPGAPAGQVSMVLGLRGPVFGVTSACASSNHAVSAAADQLRLGRADVMLAGGADAPLSYGVLKAWDALRALARETCRPFSADRDGLVIGEGAGMAVLETLDHAQARGARILGELVGCGMSADATDIVAPTVEGPAAAMRACLADAGLAPEEVDYSTPMGPAPRPTTRSRRRRSGACSAPMPRSCRCPRPNRCMPIAWAPPGALELIACVMAIREGVVPPTANYREPDPECDLDVTPNVARERTVSAALSNGFAFGGTNAMLAVSCGRPRGLSLRRRNFSRAALMPAAALPKSAQRICLLSHHLPSLDPRSPRWPTCPPSRSPRRWPAKHPDRDPALFADDAQRREGLDRAGGARAALRAAPGRHRQERELDAGIPVAQSQRQDPGDHRSRRPGRQADRPVRIRRDPALPRRQDRQAACRPTRRGATRPSSGCSSRWPRSGRCSARSASSTNSPASDIEDKRPLRALRRRSRSGCSACSRRGSPAATGSWAMNTPSPTSPCSAGFGCSTPSMRPPTCSGSHPTRRRWPGSSA